MQHLTARDYKTMPWANGRGQTVELIRVDAPDGRLLWRLSMAMVTENGPFSVFPGINRNLTVIDGPGFDLVSADNRIRADPLQPVAFCGETPIVADNVIAPCADFNVMTAAALPRPLVQVISQGQSVWMPGQIYLFALKPGLFAGRIIATHDLLIGISVGVLQDGLAIVVGLPVDPLASSVPDA